MSTNPLLLELARAVAPELPEASAADTARKFIARVPFPEPNAENVKRTLSGLVAKLRVHGRSGHAAALERCAQFCGQGAHNFPALLLELSRNPLALSSDALSAALTQANVARAPVAEVDDGMAEPDAEYAAWKLELGAVDGLSDASDIDTDVEGLESSPLNPPSPEPPLYQQSFSSPLPASIASRNSDSGSRRGAPPSSESALVDASLEALLGSQSLHAHLLHEARATTHRGAAAAGRAASEAPLLDPSYLIVARALGGVEASCRTIGGFAAEGLAQAADDWGTRAAASTLPRAPISDPAAAAFMPLLSDAQRGLVAGACYSAPEAVLCALGKVALLAAAPSFAGTSVVRVEQLAAVRLEQLYQQQAPTPARAHASFAALIGGAAPLLLPPLVTLANDLSAAAWLCEAVLRAPDGIAAQCVSFSARAVVCAIDAIGGGSDSAADALLAAPECCETPLWGDVARQFAQSVLDVITDVHGVVSAVQAYHHEFFAALSDSQAPGGDCDAVPPRLSLMGLAAWAQSQLQPTAQLLRRLVQAAFAPPLESTAARVESVLVADPLLGLGGEQNLAGLGDEGSDGAPRVSAHGAAVRRELARSLARLSLNAQSVACRAIDAVAAALDRQLAVSPTGESMPDNGSDSIDPGSSALGAAVTWDHSTTPRHATHRLVMPVTDLPALPPLSHTLARLFVGILRPYLAKLDSVVVDPCPRPGALRDLPVIRADSLRLEHRRAARWTGVVGECITAALHGGLAELVTARAVLQPRQLERGAPTTHTRGVQGGSAAPLDPMLLLTAVDDAGSAPLPAPPPLGRRIDNGDPPLRDSGWVLIEPVPELCPAALRPHSLRVFGPGMNGSRCLAPGGDAATIASDDDPAALDALWYGAGAIGVALHMREHRHMLQYIRAEDEGAWLHGDNGDDFGDGSSSFGDGGDSAAEDGASAVVGGGVFSRFGELEFDPTFATAMRRFQGSLALGAFVDGLIGLGRVDELLQTIQRGDAAAGGADVADDGNDGQQEREARADAGAVTGSLRAAPADPSRRLFSENDLLQTPEPPHAPGQRYAPAVAVAVALPASLVPQAAAAPAPSDRDTAAAAPRARPPLAADRRAPAADVRPINAAAMAAAAADAFKAKPVFGAGYMPLPGARRSAWWDLDAQVDTKKDGGRAAEAAATAATAVAATAPPPPPPPSSSQGKVNRVTWQRQAAPRGRGLNFSTIEEEGDGDDDGDNDASDADDHGVDDGGETSDGDDVDDEDGDENGTAAEPQARPVEATRGALPALQSSASGVPVVPAGSTSDRPRMPPESAQPGTRAPPIDAAARASGSAPAPAPAAPTTRAAESQSEIALVPGADAASPPPPPPHRLLSEPAGAQARDARGGLPPDTALASAAASWEALGLGTPDEWGALAYLLQQPAAPEPPDPAAVLALGAGGTAAEASGGNAGEGVTGRGSLEGAAADGAALQPPQPPAGGPSSLSLGGEPLSAVCRRDVTGVLRAQAALVSSALAAGFLASLRVAEHLWALRAVLFMEQVGGSSRG